MKKNVIKMNTVIYELDFSEDTMFYTILVNSKINLQEDLEKARKNGSTPDIIQWLERKIEFVQKMISIKVNCNFDKYKVIENDM